MAAVFLATLGWVLRGVLEKSIRDELASELQMLLETDVTALRIWMRSQEANAVTEANDIQVAALATTLIDFAKEEGIRQIDLLRRPELDDLREELQPTLEAQEYNGFIIVNSDGLVVAAARNDPVGRPAVFGSTNIALKRALNGEPTVAYPTKSQVLLPDSQGELRAERPTMFALAPIENKDGQIIGALGLRIVPAEEFLPILSVARSGDTGETYAFDDSGIIVSESRFDAELRQYGLLSDHENSILNLSIRDPGIDLTSGRRSNQVRSDLPLTKMATAAIDGKSGVDVAGYHGYRGAQVVGAWTWLPEYGIGVATEISVSEAFRSLTILRNVFFSLLGLLAVAAAIIFVFTLRIAKLQSAMRQATSEARRLGQYTLDEKLGEGGMGVVYRAHHALLHRPTAVKFLDSEKSDEQSIARFEREVQHTTQLNHPNTIAIYDYGRTEDGVFYYAMEYLDGLNLEDLVQLHGAQPDGRVVSILRQICASLHEAHSVGLIHRDIKPANIIVNSRGGVFDLVKVLDFGLVKSIDSKKQISITQNTGIVGTPLYLSPEAIQDSSSVDARSDLYAVGAVGYFLLTGSPVFDGNGLLDIIKQHVDSSPLPFSERSEHSSSADLEKLILRCLSKDPHERPQNARQLSKELAACSVEQSWTEADAETWWQRNRPTSLDRESISTSDGHLEVTVELPK
ncbi:protein kinase domain-containing protein [Bremerella sp. T1]|uniref:serine/threonine protein kinase n=1 Tax=Bremerella sp. TYQ1 TaxID=3119568 RepID=UPI001CCD8A25|nr:serine/threonine protein kinase [Bremerella volcania]UBM37045.1 serine/threonine protein kinase [Bremerella volcania]